MKYFDYSEYLKNYKTFIIIFFVFLSISMVLYQFKPTIQNFIPMYFSSQHKNYEGQNKTFVLIWTQKCKNMGDYWGFGDVIRGTIGAYELSKKYKFKLVVDISQHPISKFLNYNPRHPYQSLVYENRNNIPYLGFWEDDLVNHIHGVFYKQNILFGFTNVNNREFMDIQLPLAEDTRNFMKEILTPSNELEKLIQQYLVQLPHKDFEALHYRLGDMSSLVSSKVQIDENKLLTHVKQCYKPNCILFSDNQKFKNMIYKNLYNDIYMFHFDIGHLGYHHDYTKVLNSLIEFFILSKAKYIHSFSVYTWASGFVNSVHKIYNIPLTVVQNESFLLHQPENHSEQWNWLHGNHIPTVLENQ